MTSEHRLSAHFRLAEFRDKRTGCNPLPPPALVAVLENIRAITGEPLVVVSGHRCPSTNEAVGGASQSRHLYGDAADIPSGRATVDQAADAGAVGIGESGGWAIHVDVRPGGPARWSY
jgi:uncharacterized protein YcbK (DUF882 family)